MKKISRKISAVILACTLLFVFAACSNDAKDDKSNSSNSQASASLERYDYIADMSGNEVELTIAENLKSVQAEIKSMGLEFTSYCEVNDHTLELTEYVNGNEQVWTGMAAHTYTLNPDGTATANDSQESAGSQETADSQEAAGSLERYDYVADMSGNVVDLTIAENLKSVQAEIKSMGLEFTSYCEIDGNTLKLTELVDGNEQVWSGMAALTYTLNADGTATPNE